MKEKNLWSYYNKHVIEAGLDEAGRGCLAGPVLAAAVILPKDYKHSLLNDSKQLTKKQRNKLRVEIEKDAVAYYVAKATEAEIDKINISKASFLAMHRAVASLRIQPEHLLVDGNRFVPYPLIPHTCVVKGDEKFLSIAAASILAKTYRDDLMEELGLEFPSYRWHENAGYPTIHHRNAILQNGLTPYHRLSFKCIILKNKRIIN